MIKLKDEIDPVSLIALILAAFSAVSQLVAWSRGPKVSVFGPDRVALFTDVAPNGSLIIRVAAPLSYANTAPQSYSAILKKERVTVSVGTITTSQTWNSFGSITKQVNGFAVVAKDLATPQPVAGQSASSHLTIFAPLTRLCEQTHPTCNPQADYVSPSSFGKYLRPGIHIHFAFVSEFLRRKAQHYKCDVVASTSMVAQWRAAQSPSMYGICREAD